MSEAGPPEVEADNIRAGHQIRCKREVQGDRANRQCGPNKVRRWSVNLYSVPVAPLRTPPFRRKIRSQPLERSHGRQDSDRRSARVGLLTSPTLETTMQVVADRAEAPTAIQTDLRAIFVSLELSRSTWLITSL